MRHCLIFFLPETKIQIYFKIIKRLFHTNPINCGRIFYHLHLSHKAAMIENPTSSGFRVIRNIIANDYTILHNDLFILLVIFIWFLKKDFLYVTLSCILCSQFVYYFRSNYYTFKDCDNYFLFEPISTFKLSHIIFIASKLC